MPLGLGLGLGIGKGNIYLPASAWPTVADIPPGMVVLDSDGVGNECRWVFNNAGTDWVDCGRPAELVNLFMQENANSFCLRAVVCPSVASQITRIAGMAGSLSMDPVGVALVHVDSKMFGAVGSQTTSRINEANAANVWAAYRLEVTATHHRLISKKVTSAYVLRGTENATFNFVIGASSSPLTDLNYEGYIALVEVCDGLGNVVDAWDFNRSDLWDGGATGYSVKGNAFTVMNSSPLDIRVKALVPLSQLS